ncbi:MAG: YceH family protein [Gammaproteobacteria bacterium]|nr:YceH family protein [Gammaproteobacteria bacterium]
MLTELNDIEARVIGCLIEKSIVTPDQYPLTLNALINACNQKSSRDPVMSLTQGEVQHALRVLEAKHLVQTAENFKSRVEKFTQRFCNTRYSDLQFSDAELAVVCLLLLRGPQTPGELRSRSGRLHRFEDNAEVVQAVAGLMEREGEPLVVKLPRMPGRKDSEYMHQFSGTVDVEAHVSEVQEKHASAPRERHSVAELAERIDQLEAEVAALKQKLG